MSHTLRAATVQFPVVAGDIDANLSQVRQALQRVHEQGVKLAVLPEMWSSGYAYRQLAELAVEPGSGGRVEGGGFSRRRAEDTEIPVGRDDVRARDGGVGGAA